MKVFITRDDIESVASCIYTAWEWGLKHGHNSLRIVKAPAIQYSIFDEYEYLEADADKAARVIASIRNRLSFSIYELVYLCTLHSSDVLDDIYRFLILAYRVGRRAEHMLTEPVVIRLDRIKRQVISERQTFIEFVRFDSLNNKIMISHIEPKHNILALLSEHFSDRMPSYSWIIVDDLRGLALVHGSDGSVFVQELSERELSRLQAARNTDDDYQLLWRSFFDSISIKERENKKLQRSFLPLYRRKNMTEFKKN